MKQRNFNLGIKEPFWPRKIKIIKELFFGIFLMLFSTLILITSLEIYFRWYWQSPVGNSQTVMDLPIYQSSNYRAWDQLPGAEVKNIKINRIGLRNSEIDPHTKKHRYLMLGDSFVFGMGVNEDQTISAQLQKMLGKKSHEVINAGVIGHTIDDTYLYLKNEGIKLNPEFVVYNFFVGNDVTELRRHQWILNSEQKLEKIVDTELEVDANHYLRPILKTEKPRSYLGFWLKQKYEIYQKMHGKIIVDAAYTLTWPIFLSDSHPAQDPKLPEYWTRFTQVLREMKEYCDQHNLKLIVNIIPMDTQVSRNYWKKYPGTPFGEEEFAAQRPQKYFKKIAEHLKIPVIDPLFALQEADRKKSATYFPNDTHFSPFGHRITAAQIFQFLIDNYY